MGAFEYPFAILIQFNGSVTIFFGEGVMAEDSEFPGIDFDFRFQFPDGIAQLLQFFLQIL